MRGHKKYEGHTQTKSWCLSSKLTLSDPNENYVYVKQIPIIAMW